MKRTHVVLPNIPADQAEMPLLDFQLQDYQMLLGGDA
jgi:hypothetical protein